jgi:hypothetical protein
MWSNNSKIFRWLSSAINKFAYYTNRRHNMTEQTTTPTPAESAPAAPGLTVQDLLLTLQVVQVAASRGAFKADELTNVGGLYDRLFKFLEATGAIQAKPVEVTPEAAPTEEAPAAEPVAEVAAKKKK